MLSLTLPFLILSSLLSLPYASANTEIRNIHAFASGSSLPPAAAVAAVSEVAAAWPVLHASTPAHTRVFAIVPAPLGTPLRDVCEPVPTRAGGCEHELWVRLDLDDTSWTRFERFTLRVSWPAFYPTDFDIALYTPAALASHFQVLPNTISPDHDHAPDPSPDVEPEPKDAPTTRVQFARIRLVDTGVRPPLPSPPPSLSSLFNKPPHTRTDPVPVPFTLTLEPLLLGVLPSSLLPTLLLVVPALAVAALAIPPTLRALEGVVGPARKELGYAGLKRD